MIPTYLIFSTTLAMTLASAGVSIWLVMNAPGKSADRRQLLQRLLRVFVMGAAAIMMLLSTR